MPGKSPNRIIRALFLIGVTLIFGSVFPTILCRAQVVATQAYFLLEIPDARGRGMAGGGSVYSAGAVSAFYNPAGLISSGAFSAQIHYGKLLPYLTDNLSLKSAYFSRDFGDWGAWGVSYSRVNYGSQELVEEGGNLIKTVEIYDYSLALHGAIAFNSSNSAGFGLKYIHINTVPLYYIEKSKVTSFAMDFGFLSKGHFPEATVKIDEIYYPTLRKYCRAERDEGIVFGLSMANIGPEISFGESSSLNGPPPRSLRLAAGYQVLDADYLGLRFTIDALKLLVNTDDGFKTELREITWSFGVEATFLYIINLRAGRYHDEISLQRYTTVGLGLGPEWMRLDYSRVLGSGDMYIRKENETSYSLYFNIYPNIFHK